MRTAITSLIAVGIGAAAMSMMKDRRNRKRVMNIMEPMKNIDLNKIMPNQMKQMSKRMMRPFA